MGQERVSKSAVADGIQPLAVVHIAPVQGWVSLRIHELWEHRDLLYFLTWRDIKVRYKQTVLGAAWAILQPLLTMIIFALFFGKLARMGSEGVPYVLFSYVALVPWTFFSNSLTQASNSLVQNQHLLSKVYFPRMVIPLANVLAALIDFGLAFTILIPMLAYFGMAPSPNVVLLPLFLLLAIVTSIGASLWLSALNVQFRDVRYVIPFLTQIWMFATPIAYSSSLLSPPWRTMYGVNPMVGVVEGFRWALLGTRTSAGPMIVVSSIIAVALMLSGAFYFRRTERIFADVI